MSPTQADEISAYLERAMQSIPAAQHLASGGYFDFAVSRALRHSMRQWLSC